MAFLEDYNDFINGKTVEEIYSGYTINLRSVTNQKTVYQFTKDGEFVQKWDSCADAGRAMCSKANGTISGAVDGTGQTKSAYNFYWLSEGKYLEFKEKYPEEDDLKMAITEFFALSRIYSKA